MEFKLKFNLVGYYNQKVYRIKRDRGDFEYIKSEIKEHRDCRAMIIKKHFNRSKNLTDIHRSTLNQFLPRELSDIILHYNPILCPVFISSRLNWSKLVLNYSTFENSMKYRNERYCQSRKYNMTHVIPYIDFEDIIKAKMAGTGKSDWLGTGKSDWLDSLSMFDYFSRDTCQQLTVMTHYKCVGIDLSDVNLQI